MKMNIRMKVLLGFLVIAAIAGIGYAITTFEMSKNVKNIAEVQNVYFAAYQKNAKLATNIEKQISLYRLYTWLCHNKWLILTRNSV